MYSLTNSVRKHGLLYKFSRMIFFFVITRVPLYLRDLLFDVRYGVSTRKWEKLERLETVGDNKRHGCQYQPTIGGQLIGVLRSANIPIEGTFLDLGCGKGKALIQAAEFGFHNLLGVEFSNCLCAIADANLAKYSRKRGAKLTYAIVNTDAAIYSIPEEVTTVYMYNPFDSHVVLMVLQSIERTLQSKFRTLHVVYDNPVHVIQFSKFNMFRHKVTLQVTATRQCAVYCCGLY